MNLKYEEITLEDLDILIEEYMKYFNTYDGGTWTRESAHKRLKQMITTMDFYGLKLYNAGVLRGFILGWIKTYDDIVLYNLEEILIFKEVQNKGLGRIFMRELEERLKLKQVYRINLMSLNDNGHKNFYENLGYDSSKNLLIWGKTI